MTINLGNFQTAAGGRADRSVFVLDGNGGVELRSDDRANTLTEQDNRKLKNAFLAAVTAEYDGLAAMQAWRVLDSLATPLTTETYAQVRLALTDAHRLLLDGDAVRGQIRTELEGRAVPPVLLEQLAEQVRGAVDALALPPSAFTLARAVDRVLALHSPSGESDAVISLQEGAPEIPRYPDGGFTVEGWEGFIAALQAKPTDMASPSNFFRTLLPEVNDQHRDWYTNFVMLNQFANGLDSGNQGELQSALRQRSLGYLYKYATPGESLSELQTTPLTQPHVYHRTGGMIAENFRAELDLSLGFHGKNVFPGQHLKRVQLCGENCATAYPVASLDAFEVAKLKFSALGPGHTLLSASALDVASICTAAVKWLMDPEGGTVLIDIRGLMPRDLTSTAYAAALKKVQNTLEGVVNEQLKQYVGTDPDASTRVEELFKRLDETVALIDMTTVGKQPALILATLRNTAQLQRVVAFETLTGLMSGRGMNAGPQQILENWAQSESPERIHQCISGKTLAAMNADLVELGAPESGLREYGSFADLKDHAVISEFRKLVQASASTHPLAGGFVPASDTEGLVYQPHDFGKPYIHLLGGIMLAQLDALPQNAFEAPGDLVLAYLCNRIVGHIGNANAAKDSQIQFLDAMHLVNEEITTALTLLRPYRRDQLKLELPTLHGMPQAIEPRYAIANGGMNALSMVLSGVQAQKGTTQLNVLMQRRSYYEESAYAVGEIARYQQFAFDGRDLTNGVAALKEKLSGDVKLDLFVAEFHHNVTTDDNRYTPENLAMQVGNLLDSGVLADSCTIAIDTTMNLSSQSDITEFLDAVKQQVGSGRLNVVLFRSGQKFDMGGMDHLNAGLMATYNEPTRFAAYNAGTREASFEPSATTLQGMIHLEMHAGDKLDAYRQAIANANRSLIGPLNSARLPRALIGMGNEKTLAGDAMLQLAPSTDPNAVFLDIRSPISATFLPADRDNCLREVMGRFQRLAVANDLPCGDRPSFGFPHLNISDILGVENAKLRLTLGLEPEKGLVAVRDILVALDLAGRLARNLGATPAQMANLFREGDEFFDALLAQVRSDKKVATPLLSVDDGQQLHISGLTAHDASVRRLDEALAGCGLSLRSALSEATVSRLFKV